MPPIMILLTAMKFYAAFILAVGKQRKSERMELLCVRAGLIVFRYGLLLFGDVLLFVVIGIFGFLMIINFVVIVTHVIS